MSFICGFSACYASASSIAKEYRVILFIKSHLKNFQDDFYCNFLSQKVAYLLNSAKFL